MRYEVTLNGHHYDECCPNKLLTEDEAKIAVMDGILWLHKRHGGMAHISIIERPLVRVFHVNCGDRHGFVEMVERG